MAITKEQWRETQERLAKSFMPVEFRLPSGEVITAHKGFVAENRTALIIWIDGERSEVWGWPDSNLYRPLVKEVWRRKTRKPGASLIRHMAKKKGGKAWLKRKENAFVHEVKEYWVCTFDTAASLVRQFRKIEGLELITGEASDAGDE
ncbi:TPA: hypothetical protein NQG57_000989 [Salmonella enterica subsp. enterica serovar Infantis]|nr:hypothetical protein [Salmonella enterica subsp. enterica serovar Infantis]HCJ0429056.1 hypothetical protein [Salmonella enterica subsp. enterica serovar Infantis]